MTFVSWSGMDQEKRELEKDILAFISQNAELSAPDERFNELALRLFAYQFERNEPYANFCQGRDVTPQIVGHWQNIPAVPSMAFKEVTLTSFPVDEAAILYRSSGTTGSRRSNHYLENLTLYDASLLANFKSYVLPDVDKMRMVILGPSVEMQSDSSLTHMLARINLCLGTQHRAFYLRGSGLDTETLIRDLRGAETTDAPVCMLGTAFAFVHFLDECLERGISFRLPSGSRVMDTGGYKGKSREVPKDVLYQLYETKLGVPADHIVNEYGMTEMGSQFYDDCLAVPDHSRLRRKVWPPWVRTQIVDPETLRPLRDGSHGLLRHYDLANMGSVMAIQTDDLGVQVGEGFEILGRALGAEARGCSIAIDEFLGRST